MSCSRFIDASVFATESTGRFGLVSRGNAARLAPSVRTPMLPVRDRPRRDRIPVTYDDRSEIAVALKS